VDHHKCYTIKVSKGTPKFEPILGISVQDQFLEASKLFDLKQPTQLCTLVDKNGEGLKHPDRHLLGDQATLAQGDPKHAAVLGLFVNNEFEPT
jgi:hypothetical protein